VRERLQVRYHLISCSRVWSLAVLRDRQPAPCRVSNTSVLSQVRQFGGGCCKDSTTRSTAAAPVPSKRWFSSPGRLDCRISRIMRDTHQAFLVKSGGQFPLRAEATRTQSLSTPHRSQPPSVVSPLFGGSGGAPHRLQEGRRSTRHSSAGFPLGHIRSLML